MKRLCIIVILTFSIHSAVKAQIASFNFSAAAASVSGWTNVYGNPATGTSPITATSNGITVSSVAAGNWAGNGGVSAKNGGGSSGGTFFPAAVISNDWFQYNGATRTLANYNASLPQLQISGLNPDSFYILKMTGSDTSSLVSSPMDYTVSGNIVYASQGLYAHNNATQGITFQNIYPNSSGIVNIYVNTTSSTDIASICGLQVWSGTSNVGIPDVTITSPANNAVFAEGSNVLIAATVTEAGGTIAKVQYYNGTVQIGEVDVAPYNFTWVDPAPGAYNLAVRAMDNVGTITTVKTNITIEPMNDYWSTTGNTGNNASVNFIGNVDSVRLALRAKNIEWLSVLPTGNVGMGTIAPTAQLHTTGSVRLAGLTTSSTAPRVVVSDTLGNLFYSTSAGSGGHWQTVGGTYYDSADNIGIGTSNPQGYKLAVNGNAIFTKIVVKPITSWPDYVFEKSYRLTSIEDLKKYIDRYKHLPGITDAAQTDSAGIDVAATQTALLKKVEELTLYMIRQNAAIDELKRSNRMLQRKVRNLEKRK